MHLGAQYLLLLVYHDVIKYDYLDGASVFKDKLTNIGLIKVEMPSPSPSRKIDQEPILYIYVYILILSLKLHGKHFM